MKWAKIANGANDQWRLTHPVLQNVDIVRDVYGWFVYLPWWSEAIKLRGTMPTTQVQAWVQEELKIKLQELAASL